MIRFARILLAGALVLPLLGPGPLHAQASKLPAPSAVEPGAGFGPLAPHLDLAPQGHPWRITAGPDGAVLMENSSSPSGVTWRALPEAGPRPLQVSVRVTTEIPSDAAPQSGEFRSGAGLIYALQGQGQNSSFYALLLQPDGTLAVLRRTPGQGIRTVLTQRSGGLEPGRPVELRIVETGAGVEFHLAGRRVASLQSEAMGQGTVGITAFGVGRHTFRDFQLRPAASPGRSEGPSTGGGPGKAALGARPAEGGLRPVHDPRGISMMLPSGWDLQVPAPDQVAAIDPRSGAAALVRGRVAQGDLSAWLARTYPATEAGVASVSVLAAEAVGPDEARAVFRATDAQGRRLRAHAVAVRRGGVATVFVAAAPEESFAEALPVLAAVLDSVRFEPIAGDRGARPPQLDWVRWRDPIEGAFETQIPRGWVPQGGMMRQGTYTRATFEIASPDGRIRLLVGDAGMPRFIIPSQLHASLGLVEGQPVQGDPRLILMRFRPATEMAPGFAQRRFGQVQVTAVRDRPDIAGFRLQNQPGAMQGTVNLMTAADLEFRAPDGRVGALSIVTSGWNAPGLVGGWGVDESYGFIAPPEAAGLAGQALARVVGGIRVNPQWMASELRAERVETERWLNYLNRSAELRQRTLEHRWAVQDRQGREWRDALGNTARLVDPVTREEIEVQRAGRYFFRSTIPHRDVLALTETDNNPDPLQLRRLLEMGRDIPY